MGSVSSSPAKVIRNDTYQRKPAAPQTNRSSVFYNHCPTTKYGRSSRGTAIRPRDKIPLQTVPSPRITSPSATGPEHPARQALRCSGRSAKSLAKVSNALFDLRLPKTRTPQPGAGDSKESKPQIQDILVIVRRMGLFAAVA